VEAHWLFGVDVARIGVLIHPQSIVHAVVEFTDGGAIAQLAAADMRGPIQQALAWPLRAEPCGRRLNWSELPRLEFQKPDPAQARAIGLADRAVRGGGTAGAILNAANEAAVRAFLQRRIPFGRIVELSDAALDEVAAGPLRTLADALEAGERARAFVEQRIA
jgi:1-deoxy-D-xylulose-5-phosphate reductoisomerase